jgi:hypothetical protein
LEVSTASEPVASKRLGLLAWQDEDKVDARAA